MLVEHRQHDKSKQRGSEQAENHHYGQGPLHFRSRPGGEEQGNKPQDGHQRSHEHRAQPPFTPPPHRFLQGQTLLAQLVKLGDQHHPVEHRHAEEGDKPHRGRDAQVEAGDQQTQDAADEGQREIEDDQGGIAH